jgi:uncharacterized membrane protein
VTGFLGRFHPLLVHFPIALLVAGAGLAVGCALRARRGLAAPLRAAVSPLLWLGAASAVVAASTGYLLGSGGGYGGLVYERHQATGIAVAVSAVLAATAATLAARRPSPAARGALAVLLAATVFVLAGAGHLGATLTHGEGYLTERAPPGLRVLLAGLGLAPAQAPRGVPEEAVVFDALVQPVLRARCGDCHGAHQAMGRLRLDTAEGLRRGGEHGPVLAPGRAVASDLARRVALPPGDPRAMPPRGRRPVTAGEGALLRWWIESGAPFEARLGDVELPPDLRPVVEAALGPLAPGGPALPRAKVAAPDPKAVAALAARGASARPVADGLAFLDVRVAPGTAFGDAELALLKPIAPNVAWLNLAGTAVSDAGLPVLASLPNLVRLDLSRTAVRDLSPLASSPQLELLNVRGTGADDAGLARLGGVKTLRRVYAWQTAVTTSGVERLRALSPRVVVDTGDLPAAASTPAAGR